MMSWILSSFMLFQAHTLFQTNVLALRKEGLILDLNPAIIHAALKSSLR